MTRRVLLASPVLAVVEFLWNIAVSPFWINLREF